MCVREFKWFFQIGLFQRVFTILGMLCVHLRIDPVHYAHVSNRVLPEVMYSVLRLRGYFA